MSDRTAASILSKLTSWYPFDGDATDAHGPNDLTLAVSPGYETAKVGQGLKKGARAKVALASPIDFGPTTGQISVGGWLHYSSAVPSVAPFGLTGDPNSSHNEAYYLFSNSTDGAFGAFGWKGDGTSFNVIDPSGRALSYPVAVKVRDASGKEAVSAQTIRVGDASSQTLPGFYFVVATWNAGHMSLYVDGVLVATANPPASTQLSSITHIQVANALNATVSDAGLDECFICSEAVLTADEVSWLYNAGAGRSYTDLTMAAA